MYMYTHPVADSAVLNNVYGLGSSLVNTVILFLICSKIAIQYFIFFILNLKTCICLYRSKCHTNRKMTYSSSSRSCAELNS